MNSLGMDRDDIHWGMMLSMFYNANRESGTAAKRAEDFMPYREQEIEADEDFIARLRGMVGR